MIGLSASVAPTDASGVYALIGLITDAKASKARLDALAKATDEANKATDAAKTEQAIAKQAKVEASVAEKDAAKAFSDAELAKNSLAIREKALFDAKQNLEARENAVAERGVMLDNEFKRRETALAAREKTLQANTVALLAAQDELNANREAFEKKAAALKSVIGG